jgi:hypothetical protein
MSIETPNAPLSMPTPGLHRGRQILKLAVYIVFTLAMLFATALYVMRTHSIVYKSSAIPDGTGEPEFCVFNPFRDRDPEEACENFLTSLKEQRCEESVAKLPLTEDQRRYTCEKEMEHPLEYWRLESRNDSPDKTRLFYWHWRTDHDSHELLWMTAERQHDRWQVTDYECWY